jgi:hypothetical protein
MGSTQPLTEMRTRNLFWGGGVKTAADNMKTFMCRLCGKSRSLNLLEPWGPVMEKLYLIIDINKPLTDMRSLYRSLTSYITHWLCLTLSHWTCFVQYTDTNRCVWRVATVRTVQSYDSLVSLSFHEKIAVVTKHIHLESPVQHAHAGTPAKKSGLPGSANSRWHCPELINPNTGDAQDCLTSVIAQQPML